MSNKASHLLSVDVMAKEIHSLSLWTEKNRILFTNIFSQSRSKNKLLYLIFFLNTTAPSQKGHRWQTLLSYKSMLQCFMVAKKKVGRGKKWVAFFQASSHLHSLEMAYISTNQERPLKAWYILSLHICKQTQPFKKKKRKRKKTRPC